MRKSYQLLTKLGLAMTLLGAIAIPAHAAGAATSSQTVALKVLLIGDGPSDPTTVAWEDGLTSEGVPFTEVDATGTYGSETVTLPALTSSATSGNYNAVVLADADAGFTSGQLTALYTYESNFGIRQIAGNSYPDTTRGETAVASPVTTLDNTTGTITAAGQAAMPALTGILPFDTGTYGVEATAGTGFTPWFTNSTGVLGGVYQHPSTDAQANVSELVLNFDYNNVSLQWLLLAPELINWVTQDAHLGLYRNYFGQDIDDNFIADNEWSSQYQCTPAATDPTDYTCPAGVAGNPADTPANVQMSAADVAYVVAWEQSSGITLNLAFNGVGACTEPSAADYSDAVCNGTVTDNGTTYTLPGDVTDADPSDGYADDSGLINALLADKADFNWVIHTWSHEFLGCNVFQQQPITSAVASATGGTLAAGAYNYEITAATAYGESEPSAVLTATTTGTTGSVVLTWPNATNGVSGTGATGTAGPTLAQEEAIHTGGTGFWGYNIYRENPGSTTFGYIGQVPENGTQATYTYTDTGATAPGVAPSSAVGNPTATNPGIDCAPNSNGISSWDPAADPAGTTDDSIQTEIAWDQAFATANALPNYTASTVVTGEHSGIENPNMPAALAATGITVFATDASRQPTQYSLGSGATIAESSPRYPSNIYYNASNWPDELNEYNTLYVDQGVSLGDTTYPSDVGHCTDTSSTTCLAAPATEATLLASESRIMLSHVLNNDPRVGYAHQTDLINDGSGAPGSSTQLGYTILALINDMQSQYASWTNTPLIPMTDTTEAGVLSQQAAWATALATGKVTASEQNGVISVTNITGAPVNVPITAPSGTTVAGASFAQPYGGAQSGWTSVTSSGLTLNPASSSIIGTVTAASGGADLTNICVYLYPVGVSSAASYATCTGTNGTFSFSGVATGSYDVAFADPSGADVTQWYTGSAGGAVSQSGAVAVAVTAGGATITGINAAMSAIQLGNISGTVTAAAGGANLANICVYLYPVGVSSAASYATCTAANGTYSLSSVASGSYDVAFATSAGTYATQWYSGSTTGAATQSAAVAVTIPSGNATVAAINAAMGPVELGNITGTVTAATGGADLTNICVYLYPVGVTSAASYATCTAANGTYTIGNVTSGNYDVAFADPGGTYATQWHTGSTGGAATQSAAVAVTIPSGNATLAGINAAMSAVNVGKISGTVTASSGGADLANICIYLYPVGVSSAASYATCTAANGTYTIGNVTSGNYDVAFADPGGTYATQWHTGSTGGAATQSAAVAVTIPSGNATLAGINAAMSAVNVGKISGTVTASSGGADLANICIYLYPVGVSSAASYATCTAANGTYTIGNVTSGNYDVAFADPVGTYATQWHTGSTGGAATQSAAVAVTIPSGNATLAGINAAMSAVS